MVIVRTVMNKLILLLVCFMGCQQDVVEEKDSLQITTFITAATSEQPAYLWVRFTIPDGRRLYAMYQKPGIKVPALMIQTHPAVGEFVYTGPPGQGDQDVVYHTGEATYNAPIGSGQRGKITGTIRYRLCSKDLCFMPVTKSFVATKKRRHVL